MSDTSNNSQSTELGVDALGEMHELCALLYDGVSTHDDCERFNRLLDSSEEARRLYLSYVGLNCRLQTHVGRGLSERENDLRRYITEPEVVIDDSIEIAGNDLEPASRQELLGSSLITRRIGLFALASAALLAFILLPWAQQSTDEGLTASSQQQVPADLDGHQSSPVGADPGVARCTYISQAVAWRQHSDTAVSSMIQAGAVLAFERGEVELTYESGTRLLLIGPAEFFVEDSGGRLVRGGLVASVTEAGHGFTIETPGGRVVDLGTEFGVAVDDFGVSEVRVFEGEVEAFPSESSDGQHTQASERKIRLTEGLGLQWDTKSLRQFRSNTQAFLSSTILALRGGDHSPTLYSSVDRFTDQMRWMERWSVLGQTRVASDGLIIRSEGDSSGSPYLVSKEQYDPANGPITVTCDFSFADEASIEHATFAVLTRSHDERGIALPPWRGTLASCARCSFERAADADSQKGVLRAGVKMESNRELTSISLSGFAAPQVGVPYRLVTKDDGVHLTCTISLRDDPSLSTTLRCRSLFRGGANHIALEGSESGSTRIESVCVAQSSRRAPAASYASFSRLVRLGNRKEDGLAGTLAGWSPRDAELVVHEEFDQGQLDSAVWEVLGDARVIDGELQLGTLSKTARIDTWRPRPYLILKPELDPQEGAITVIGQVRFADNFRSGFGGTYGILTRAGNRHGEGPEWEQSVLERGLRATFWPSAWNPDRRLEVYERSSSKRPMLLATQPTDIDPRQNTYLFRLVDDGESVEFSVMDPTRSETASMVEAKPSLIRNSGHVAFESCWGSPVTLDNISVFRAGRGAASSSP